VVLVTHNIEEGLSLATHAAIMHRGRLVRTDSRSALDPAEYAAAYRELVTVGE